MKQYGPRRGQKSKQIFWKYLASYICIALLPMLLNSVLSYTLIRDYLVVQADQNRNKSISYTEHLLNQQISALVNISSEMSLKSPFSVNQEKKINVERFYDITDYLMSNKAKNRFAYDILYADLSHKSIYTASGLYFEQDFSHNLYAYSSTDLFRAMESIQLGQILLLPSETVLRYEYPIQVLTIVVPISYQYEGNQYVVKSCAIFLIEKSTVDKIVQNALQTEGAVGVLYYGQTPVYCSQENLMPTLPEKTALGDIVALNDHSYGIFSDCDTRTGELVSMAVMVPENELNTVRNIILGSVAIVSFMTLLLCGLMIICFMKLNYKPLQRLSVFVKRQQSDELPQMNEMETIQYVVSKLSEKQSELLANNELLRRERCFYALVDSSHPLDERFRIACMQAGLYLEGPCYQVIILANEENKAFHPQEPFAPLSKIYWNATILPDKVLLVMSGSREELEKDAACIAQWETEKGFGFICDTIEGLRGSLDEAQKQFCRPAHFDLLPLSEIRSAHTALSNGNMKQFRLMSQSIGDWVKQSGTPEAAAMAFGFFVVGSLDLIRSQEEPFIAVSQLEKKYAVPPSGIDNTVSAILSFADEICKAVKEKSGKEKASIQNILAYIGSSCFDQTFSIKVMADHFGISSSNLSHFFKNKMEMSLSQYIQSIRLAKAKELLLSTSLPVTEIISIIGYTDTSSFIRRFKSETGMTPGEFRNGPQA